MRPPDRCGDAVQFYSLWRVELHIEYRAVAGPCAKTPEGPAGHSRAPPDRSSPGGRSSAPAAIETDPLALCRMLSRLGCPVRRFTAQA